MKFKICSKCKKRLSLDQFNKGNDKNGLQYICISCNKERHKIFYKEHKEEIYKKQKKYNKKYCYRISSIYRLLKNNAKSRNIAVSISIEEFGKWYNSQEQKCYYCGRILEEIKQEIKETKTYKGRLSIDRKDNSIDYNLDNIVLACRRCNTIKSNYFTEQEMLKIGVLIKNFRRFNA